MKNVARTAAARFYCALRSSEHPKALKPAIAGNIVEGFTGNAEVFATPSALNPTLMASSSDRILNDEHLSLHRDGNEVTDPSTALHLVSDLQCGKAITGSKLVNAFRVCSESMLNSKQAAIRIQAEQPLLFGALALFVTSTIDFL